jgi:CheY-like chemotaxis protein
MVQNKILAVDDEPYNLEIIEEILEDDYQLHCVNSGPECLKIAEELKPRVILLDVSMPNMDGYEVCRKLKENPATSEIVVMFVSARGTVEERIAGYDVGAEDYIVKPFGNKELQSKLSSLFEVIENREMLELQVEDATSAAFNAMSLSSEMGTIVQYIENIGTIDEPKELASALSQCLKSFGLKTCSAFLVDKEVSHFSSEGICSPMVIELFELLKNKGRLYEFSPRILVNYPTISLLILNMPLDDPEKLGRIRDHTCFIVSVTEQKLNAILTARVLKYQEMQLKRAFALVKSRFEELVCVLNLSHEMNEAIFRELQEEFENRIPYMGLDEDQELYIFKKLDATIQKSVAREDLLTDVKSAFFEIEDDLSHILD